MSLASVDTATRLDEIIRRKVIQVLDQERPRPRYGEITQIDRDLRTCQVQWPDGSIVTVKLGEFQPSAIGQVVRVSDYAGHLWITGIQGDTVLSGAASVDIAAPTAFAMSGLGDGVYATWVAVAEADRYEVVIAEDAAFTINDRAFTTVDISHAVPDLTPATLYYGRVRAISSQGSVGPWSNTDTATPPGIASGGTDGNAPAASPAAIVDPGIGDLQISWVPTTNADTVTYEVHASVTSGFTPGPTTFAGETTGAFYAINRMPDNSPLDYDNNTFIRLIAKDADGPAAAGAQGFGAPSKVGAADFDVLFSEIGDGNVPPDVGTVTATGGKGYIFATWDEVANDDLVAYEVHVGTAAGFTPTVNTLVEVNRGTFAMINNEPPGMGGGPVQYTTTYFIKILATDVDGPAVNPSTAVSANPLQITSADITTGSVNGTHIAALSIGAAQIIDGTITTAKIGDGEITNAKIANLAVDAAKIANATISGAKIALATITDANIASLDADKITAGTINAIDITGGTITGSAIQTAATGDRVIIDHALGTGTIFLDTGNVLQSGNGAAINTETRNIAGTDYGVLLARGPDFAPGVGPANIELLTGTNDERLIYTGADNFDLQDESLTINLERSVFNYGPSQGYSFELRADGDLVVVGPTNGLLLALKEGSLIAKRDTNIGMLLNASGFFIRDATDSYDVLELRDTFSEWAFESNNRKVSFQSNGAIVAYRNGGSQSYLSVTDAQFVLRDQLSTYDRFICGDDYSEIRYFSNNRRAAFQSNGQFAIYDGVGTGLWAAPGTLSDRNLKKNIGIADPAEMTQRLREIPLVDFEFKNPDHGEGRRTGVIAQDVEAVHPHGVTVPEVDGNYLLDHQGMIMMLLGAIKDLDARLLIAEAQ